MFRNYINLVGNDFKSRFEATKNSYRVKRTTTSRRPEMESEFVTIDKLPIRIDSWGGYLPSKIISKKQEKPKELILFIPGNPGITKFYEEFLSRLYENIKKPIWIVSHGGHDKTSTKLPRLLENKYLYSLQGQVDQKSKLISTYLEGVQLHCVGHSIGCKMIMELLKDDKKAVDIQRCIMLFPTLERMAETPNGANVIFVLNYILWLTLLGSVIFIWLPKFLQIVLLRIYCLATSIPSSNMPAMWRLIDPHVLSRVFFLAEDEMKAVRELDHDVLKLHGEKMRLYYGSRDGWVPLRYFIELKEKHTNVNAELCKRGYHHTFVLSESKGVADLVASWLKQDILLSSVQF